MSIQLIRQYHAQVERIVRYSGSRNESALRKPFQDLLGAYASSKNLLPFYEDFRWGKQLMDLHLNYEQVKPYRLKREDKKQDLRGF